MIWHCPSGHICNCGTPSWSMVTIAFMVCVDKNCCLPLLRVFVLSCHDCCIACYFITFIVTHFSHLCAWLMCSSTGIYLSTLHVLLAHYCLCYVNEYYVYDLTHLRLSLFVLPILIFSCYWLLIYFIFPWWSNYHLIHTKIVGSGYRSANSDMG